ncbi:MAG: hypothetical protein Q8N23_05990 [Archangium sp.]|nr:hypothetical protein [Archangium sp.]MDP3152201.1 hypothetical protein [Archangium sp.]MDP3574918.1 hypothetical protein [Archangium sp.]
MLAFALTLTLCAAPSARLMPEDPVLSADQVVELDREMRILNARILELKPRMPTGFILGIAFGFSFAVLLLPGLPLVISGALIGGSALLVFGGVLTAIGGLGLLAAILCIALGNNVESDMADERARMVERRDALKRQLAPYRQAPVSPVPPYVPGVQLDVPAPRLMTLARF